MPSTTREIRMTRKSLCVNERRLTARNTHPFCSSAVGRDTPTAADIGFPRGKLHENEVLGQMSGPISVMYIKLNVRP